MIKSSGLQWGPGSRAAAACGRARRRRPGAVCGPGQQPKCTSILKFVSFDSQQNWTQSHSTLFSTCRGQLGSLRCGMISKQVSDRKAHSFSTRFLIWVLEFESTVLNGTVLCGAMTFCIPAKNTMDLNDGRASCGIPSDRCLPMVKNCGCSSRDAAFTANCLLCCVFPCIAAYWRMELRNVYGIDGHLCGDCAACLFCFPCMVMQEAREIKKRGVS
jgi:Cys-rich protein (TIGR01571 family)